jgi:hypothetical protein
MAATTFYRAVLRALLDARVPFLIGGSYALARHTRLDRRTKDLDLMIERGHWPAAVHALRAHGISTRLSFPHWLGKAIAPGAQVDVIFSSGNGLCLVDDTWFRHAEPARVLGFDVQLVPPEELIWSKAFVMERERFDGADVLHLMRATGRRLDWTRLCARFSGHEAVLAAHLVLLAYVYPGSIDVVPDGLLATLLARVAEVRAPSDWCRGTFLSRAQYLTDVTTGGLVDPRQRPDGPLTLLEIDRWTNAIDTDATRRPVHDPQLPLRRSRRRAIA